jgi:hypothetical protein
MIVFIMTVLSTMALVVDNLSPLTNEPSFCPSNETISVHDDVHCKLCSITPVATKVHVILRSFVVLTWMHDTIDLV